MISNRLIQDFFFFPQKGTFFFGYLTPANGSGGNGSGGNGKEMGSNNPSCYHWNQSLLQAGDSNDSILDLWVRKLFYYSQQIAIILNGMPKKWFQGIIVTHCQIYNANHAECLLMATKPDALTEGSVPFEVSLQVRCAFVLLKQPILKYFKYRNASFFWLVNLKKKWGSWRWFKA